MRTAKLVSTDELRRLFHVAEPGRLSVLALSYAELATASFIQDLAQLSSKAYVTETKATRDALPNWVRRYPLLDVRHIEQGLDQLVLTWGTRKPRFPLGSRAA